MKRISIVMVVEEITVSLVHQAQRATSPEWIDPLSKISLFCDSQKKSLLGFSQTFML